jgi:hypothetical protein
LSAQDLDDLNIEIIRNTLYKSYLEDFHAFVLTLPGPTSEIMSRILQFEADRRSINITLNSFNTDLSKEQRARLFPAIGKLYPEGNNALARADDVDQVKLVCDNIMEYRPFFDAAQSNGNGNGGGSSDEGQSLEDRFFAYDVHLNKMTFLQQFQFGVFYSFVKLKEQEIRNLTWIAEYVPSAPHLPCLASADFHSPSFPLRCIAQDAKLVVRCCNPAPAPLTEFSSGRSQGPRQRHRPPLLVSSSASISLSRCMTPPTTLDAALAPSLKQARSSSGGGDEGHVWRASLEDVCSFVCAKGEGSLIGAGEGVEVDLVAEGWRHAGRGEL